MSKKLNIGIIGLGEISSAHFAGFGSNPHSEIIAICDSDEKWLEYCKKEHGVRYGFTKWQDLIACEELDAVAVCLPNVFHAEVSIAALNAGKHVLCEKPMAANVDDARNMVEAANRSGKILMVSYNQRFSPDIQYIKRYVDEGNLGEIYFVRTGWRRPMGMFPGPGVARASGEYSRNWFNEKAMGGGVCFDLGSHVVDLAMYLMGFPKVKSVTGCAYTKFLPEVLKDRGVTTDADDHSVGFVKFENGASMHFEASFGSYVERQQVFQALYGNKGGVYREIGAPVKLFSSAAGAYTTIVPRIDLPVVTPMAHFVECIIENKTPIVTPEQGLAVTEILEGILKSTEAF
ncbi:MAG: Gfo/Idh/MocA family oxidoreductase [Armatimonadetes bacterium]|nr:Gfo/Idh/MocA family oxidoreductase [Armatimonadota bacterium]